MVQTIQIVALCLALITGVCGDQNPPAAAVCCIATPSPTSPCQSATTTTTPAPFVCPLANGTPSSPAPAQMTSEKPSTIKEKPSTSTIVARQPDPNPSEQPPNFVIPTYPGIPHMPMLPYPILGNYMPILQDPTTGQRYYVMRNPNLPTNKYSQILNIYTPDMNPGYYIVPTAEPQANNGTTTVKPSDKS
ncbi:unnamed protein product, partial [Iphiclides podalirius]